MKALVRSTRAKQRIAAIDYRLLISERPTDTRSWFLERFANATPTVAVHFVSLIIHYMNLRNMKLSYRPLIDTRQFQPEFTFDIG